MVESIDPTALDAANVAELERICDRFESALRAGERPRIEDELPALPEPARGTLLVDLIALELAYRRRADERPEPAEYLARFPESAWAVHAAFHSAEANTIAAEGLTTAPVGHGRGPDDESGALVSYFGDYELRGILGRGGMGVVYRAVQLSLRRPVALKMIRSPSMASEEERRRFRNEAEIAAGLDHSNIVPVYEVGEHEGQPYLTMRLIDGEGLDRRLPAFANDPRGAARVVQLAAEAVDHAHRRGVLHRDLKPANILMDAAGLPHVADFGLARLAHGAGDLTHTGAVLGTPAYMAPEQAGGRRGATTVATDLHGLGAILYALLTGRAPFTGESVAAILERVREAAPDPPSRLNPRVPRDLEVICLKCLEKDPSRRFSSAQELADDLGRYLAGEPIRARPVGRLARLGMWARRRPAIAALAAALAIAVLSGVAGMAWQWRRAVVERDKSEAVSQFLIKDLLAEAAPDRNERGRNVTLLEVLDRASKRIDGAFPNQTDVEATLRLMIGQVYVKLGEAGKAEPHLERARRLFVQIGASDSTEALSAGNDLAVSLFKQGRLAEAEAAFREVLDGHRRTLGEDAQKTLVTMSNLGDVLRFANRLDEADSILRAASSGLNRRLGPTDPASLRAMGNLAIVAHARELPDEAGPLYRQALDAYSRAGKKRHPEYLSMLNNYAILLQAQNDRDGAAEAFREILEARREVLSVEHPETLMSMNNLADLLVATGETREAEALLREALDILGRSPDRGAKSEVGAFANANLADILAARGQAADAERHYRASLDIARAVWPADHPTVRAIQEHLDAALRKSPSQPSPH